MSKKKDTIFISNNRIKKFEFTQEVVDVFEDMLDRSIPGYRDILNNIAVITSEYVRDGTNIYDLGTSLGDVPFAIQKVVKNKGCKIIAVDSSEAMIEQFKSRINKSPLIVPVELHLKTAESVKFCNASVIIMNFVLQFIPIGERISLLKSIYGGLIPGGVLILSEKVLFSDKKKLETLDNLFYTFKRYNGYSEKEIERKRNSLENVLVRESEEDHISKLLSIGFKDVYKWYQNFNFSSFIAIK